MVKITDKEAICILVLFLLGSSIVIGTGTEVENDAWIAGIFGLVFFIPFALIYARIQALYYGKDLFEISKLLFGKTIGTFIIILYTWYSLHLGALVLRNFSEFANITTLNDTPLIVVMLSFSIIIIAAARSGIEVIGRLCTYALPLVIFVLFLMEMLSIRQMQFNHIKPVFVHGFPRILEAGFSAFSFPFAESVVFLGVFYALKKKNSAYKVLVIGAVISDIILITLTMVNIFILGAVVKDFYFPSYSSFARIRLGNFLQKMEGTISVSYAITCLIKSSVCLFVACKGISALFGLEDYGLITIQTGLIMTYLSFIVYDNTVEMQNWVSETYSYYAFPFQVIIPVIAWIFAEIKSRWRIFKEKSKKSGTRKRKNVSTGNMQSD